MGVAARRYEQFAVHHRTGVLVLAFVAVCFGELFGFAMWFGMAMTGDGDTLGSDSTSTPTFWLLNAIRIAMALALALAVLTRPVPTASRWFARASGAALGLTSALVIMFLVLLTVTAL